jgi:hypothetical protein
MLVHSTGLPFNAGNSVKGQLTAKFLSKELELNLFAVRRYIKSFGQTLEAKPADGDVRATL